MLFGMYWVAQIHELTKDIAKLNGPTDLTKLL